MTIAQTTASDPQVSAWVEASAGTGKTKVLTDRVLRLLLSGTEPGRILCLTFTRAAAAEMENRLSERLGRWCRLDDERLADDLLALTNEVPDQALLARARRLFALMLDAPGGMKIQTIHSFCQSLLGRFPLEAGIPPHFSLIDERTSQEIMFEARERVVGGARDGDLPELTDAMRVITTYVREDEFGQLMDALSRERGRLVHLMRHHGGVDGVLREVRRVLGVADGATVDGLIAEACAEGAFDRSGLQTVCSIMLAAGKTDRENGQRIADWLSSSDRVSGYSSYRQAFFTTSGSRRAKLCHGDTIKALSSAVDILAAETLRLEEVRLRINAILVAEATSALLRLGGDILTEYERSKAALAVLDYDDLVIRVCDLLTDRDATLWVLYKLDGGLDHILVDEAQDTNPEQWQVIAALAGEFFSGKTSREENRTVFAVGDTKQSIYSFQRADPAGFERMRDLFSMQGAAVGRPVVDVSLDVSFRSTEAVLASVDAVFALADARKGVGRADVPICHQARRIGEGGLVEVWPLVEKVSSDEEEQWSAPVEYRYGESGDIRLAKGIAGQIATWLASGEMLESKGRPVRPGDILVLVRRRTKFVDALVRALKERDLPVAGADRMVLTDQIAVMDMMALGRFLLLQEDDLSLACLLKSPLFQFDEDRLFTLCHGRKGSLWASLGEKRSSDAMFAAAYEELCGWLGMARQQRPYELFATILGAGGGRRRMLSRLGPDAADPLEEFLSLALAYEGAHTASLQGFLQWMDSGQAEIKRDLEQNGRDEVRIMTIHGAKGLQAPIVFLPDTVQTPSRLPALMWPAAGGIPLWSPRRDTDDPVCWSARTLATEDRDREYRRLLYVAMTRAEDRLYVCGWKSSRDVSPDSWYELIRAGLEPHAQTVPLDFTTFCESGWAGDGLRMVSAQTVAAPSTAAQVNAVPVSQMPDFVGRTAPDEPTPSLPLVPSRPDGEEPPVRSPFDGGDPARFLRGRLIHKLLELLPGVPPDKREKTCREFLASPLHDLTADLQAEITRETLAVLSDPRFAVLFGPDSQAEVPVVGVVGNRVMSGQIDRLAVTADQVLVIDYKSNRVPPSASEDVPGIYLRQMACYRAALKAIYPDRAICCGLLYTAGPGLIELSDELLNRHLPVGLQ